MTKQVEESLYSDLAFNPMPNQKGDISLVYDIASINQSLYNIIRTRKGARPFYPDFGCSFQDLLFEPLSTQNAKEIARNVKQNFTNYEPRVRIVQMNMNINTTNNTYEMSIVYEVKTTKQRQVFTYVFQKL